jgi:hypothetical protein
MLLIVLQKFGEGISLNGLLHDVRVVPDPGSMVVEAGEAVNG